MSRKFNLIVGMFVATLVLIPLMLPPRRISPKTNETPVPTVSDHTNEIRQIAIVATNYEYDINEIKLKKGEMVELTITSEEGTHNFSVNDLALASPVVAEGESATIKFEVDLAPGVYEYYCALSDHRLRGMTGELIVE